MCTIDIRFEIDRFEVVKLQICAMYTAQVHFPLLTSFYSYKRHDVTPKSGNLVRFTSQTRKISGTFHLMQEIGIRNSWFCLFVSHNFKFWFDDRKYSLRRLIFQMIYVYLYELNLKVLNFSYICMCQQLLIMHLKRMIKAMNYITFAQHLY